MTVRVPIRTIYTNGNPTGLGEFQTADAVGYLHGGTGLTSIGTAGQVISVNDSANGFVFTTTTSYADSDARHAISVTDAGGDGSLAYNNSTGVLTYTGPSAAEARAHISVTDAGGDGSASYNSSTGVITYTGPSASEVRAHISGGTGVTVSSGAIAIGQAVATNSNVQFANIVATGNLTVSGTTTTVNTETINLADNIILFNSNQTGSASENAGIEVERGDDTNKTLIWNESTDKWTVGSETFIAGTFEGNVTGNVTGSIDGDSGDLRTFTANSITANGITGPLVGNVDGDSGDFRTFTANSITANAIAGALTGNASTATALADGRTIALTGDVTGTSGSFDGSGNLTFATDIAANVVGATELNVSGNGTSGQALLSDGDGSFSFGAAGASITNDNSTDTTQNVVMGRTSSGSLTASFVAASKLTFNPSSGILNSVDFNATSDESLKTNIETIQDVAAKVSQLRGVNFNWKDNDRYAMGVIAQEVEKVIPEVVNKENGTKSVSYGAIVGLLIEAVKDLQNQVDELKK